MYNIDSPPLGRFYGKVLAVDPGNVTGAALFDDMQLLTTFQIRRNRLWIAHLPNDARVIVCELPRIYSPRQSKGDPNDLVGLILQCGELCGAFGVEQVRMVRPQRWKSQHTKTMTRARVRRALSDDERDQVIDDHNVYDAVGIGLWFLGRY